MEAAAPQSLCCVASLTPKVDAGRNEDAATVFPGAAPSLRALAVADGLGSYTHAREAAGYVIDRIAQLSPSLKIDSAERLALLFTKLRLDLRIHVRNLPAAPGSERGSYGTTLLVAVETPSQLIAAYVGNGGIWHLPGNFAESTGPAGLPWSAANYLRPHSFFDEGKERLYNIIDLSERFDGLPASVITVNKDRRHGDILVLCTDGIYSADQAIQGFDEQGDLWVNPGAALVPLCDRFRSCLSQPCDDASLSTALEGYLQDLKTRNLLEDDATLGVIVTREALAYQKQTG
jgi:serine/threonine protein phosphatase PrpC